MLSKIRVATEASETSRGLIECLDGLRRVGSQRAVLAHVVNVRDDPGTRAPRLVLPHRHGVPGAGLSVGDVLGKCGAQHRAQGPASRSVRARAALGEREGIPSGRRAS